MMPDLASMAAQESSMETVPIMITTSRIKSSSAEPKDERSEHRSGEGHRASSISIQNEQKTFTAGDRLGLKKGWAVVETHMSILKRKSGLSESMCELVCVCETERDRTG